MINTSTEAPVTLTYTNWKGETAQRRIIPRRIWWGATEWHPDPQWLLTAFDVDKQAERDFALKDFGQPVTVQDAARVPCCHQPGLVTADILRQISEATDPDFIWGALDNVHDCETTLDDYADAVSRAQRTALRAIAGGDA